MFNRSGGGTMLVNIINPNGKIVKTVKATQTDGLLRNYPTGYKMEIVK